MHCELVIPGLFDAAAKKNTERLAALELLLARGRQRAHDAQRLEAWLQEAFELGERAFPAGALTLLAHGGDPGEACWARADPVHLRLMRDRLVVVPAAAFELSAQEAHALCDALNTHFGDMGFTAAEPKRWCARLPQMPPLDGGNPLDVAGREVELPEKAAPLLNEVQMVLHAHPVNEAREARGEPTVNSVWLWGTGSAERTRCRWQSVAADDPAVIGAARLAGARQRAAPRSARDWLERLPEDGRHLVVLDALRTRLALGQEAALDELEQHWFQPLLAALRAGRIGMVTLHVPDGAEALSFETIRADLRRFWRIAKPLEHYA
jgi:hypothetical protein